MKLWVSIGSGSKMSFPDLAAALRHFEHAKIPPFATVGGRRLTAPGFEGLRAIDVYWGEDDTPDWIADLGAPDKAVVRAYRG